MYDTAPTSRPQVGWLAMITPGCVTSERPRISFWILPPDSERAGASSPPQRTSNCSTIACACVTGRTAPQPAQAGESRLAIALGDGVFPHREVADHTDRATILRHARHTGADERARDCVQGTPVDLDRAALRLQQAVQRVGELRLAIAGDPGDAEDLAAPALRSSPA